MVTETVPNLGDLSIILQAATDAVKGLADEATKAKAASERLQHMVASLTADNLVFVMRLKKSERELQAASQERDELQLAADEQRGPWFDEVRHGCMLLWCPFLCLFTISCMLLPLVYLFCCSCVVLIVCLLCLLWSNVCLLGFNHYLSK